MFDPWVRKISWRRKWQPTPVFLPEKSYGLGKNPIEPGGASLKGHKKSDVTEQLSTNINLVFQELHANCPGFSDPSGSLWGSQNTLIAIFVILYDCLCGCLS